MDGDHDAELHAALALSLEEANKQTQETTEPAANIKEPTTNSIESTNIPTQNISQIATNNTPTQPLTTPPNETLLATLIAMGFPEADSRKALNATNNTGIEAATNWLIRDPSAAAAPFAALFAPFQTKIKMVLVVRTDLKMGVEKIAAQCGHASVGIYKDLAQSRQPKDRDLLHQWENCASPKIALKIENYDEMMKLEAKASSLKLPTHVVLDAGRTQVAPGSATVLSIMGPAEIVDQVTGGLKLL